MSWLSIGSGIVNLSMARSMAVVEHPTEEGVCVVCIDGDLGYTVNIFEGTNEECHEVFRKVRAYVGPCMDVP